MRRYKFIFEDEPPTTPLTIQELLEQTDFDDDELNAIIDLPVGDKKFIDSNVYIERVA